jgi:predicted  nucleic acid-binding Zn-ribbon protein
VPPHAIQEDYKLLDQLRCLIEYQKIEDKKNQLVRGCEGTPKRIAELEKEFELFEGGYLSKKAEHENAKKMHKAVEQNVAELEARLARQKSRQAEVKTNKEYQAIIKEMDETKKEIAQNEDSALEFMEKIETLGGELKELEKEVAERRKKFEEDKAVLEDANGKLKVRLDRLEEIRNEVRGRLDADLLKRTDFLLQKQAGIAVSSVENGVCQVCHMNIPPQKFIELQRDESLMQCPHCHRFIYWPGHEGYCGLREDVDQI